MSGSDVSGVRVHDSGRAAALNANAYARGEQIHVGGNQHAVAHEAAHVVQQARANLFADQY